MAHEQAKLHTVTEVFKFHDPKGEVYEVGRFGEELKKLEKEFYDYLYEKKKIVGNLFLEEGINCIWTALCGGSFTPFDSANAHIGVGDGTDPEDYTQDGLTGANIYYKSMDSGYPTYGVDRKATFRATFGGTEANFTWNEWTVANGSDNTAINLNRRVESLGTKSEGSTWIMTVELSIG
ncbi:MAG: hypothetical protein ACTSYJ_05005 [Candidatus Thorarchaeota archaeon]